MTCLQSIENLLNQSVVKAIIILLFLHIKTVTGAVMSFYIQLLRQNFRSGLFAKLKKIN